MASMTVSFEAPQLATTVPPFSKLNFIRPKRTPVVLLTISVNTSLATWILVLWGRLFLCSSVTVASQ
jgi:hypothetical protein